MKSDQRRRRLRLIKTVEERAANRFRSAASALMVASESTASRNEIELIRQKLAVECQSKPSTCLRIELPGAEPISVMMDRPYFMIGSDSRCDVRLDHEDVSPRHSLLQWVGGHLFCCHIGPRTSLFPDRSLAQNGRWVNHEPIAVGPFGLTLAEPDAEVPDYSPLDRSPQLASEYPLLALQFEGVEQSDNVWSVNRKLTIIGRSAYCKLRLNHKAIAPAQACLLRTPNGCWLIDLVGDGTTGVNNRSIQISSVDIGDILHFGAFQVEVVTTEIPSVVPMEPIAKSLPPIRFDRQPKKHPVRSNEAATNAFGEEPLKFPTANSVAIKATTDAVRTPSIETDMKSSLVSPETNKESANAPKVQFASPRVLLPLPPPIQQPLLQPVIVAPKESVPTTTVNSSTPEATLLPLRRPETAPEVPVVSMVTSSTAIPPTVDNKATLPTSRFHPPYRLRKIPDVPVENTVDQPIVTGSVFVDTKLPNCSPSQVIRPETTQQPQERSGQTVPEPLKSDGDDIRSMCEMLPLQPRSQAIETPNRGLNVIPAKTESSSSSSVSVCAMSQDLTATCARSGDLCTTEDLPKSNLKVIDESISQFIQQQQAELATLKTRLDVLKEIYDRATGQLISKKMRDTLEKPVLETLLSHDAMQEALARFIQIVEAPA